MIVGSPRAACSTRAGKFLRACSAPFLAGVFMDRQMRLGANDNCTLCTDSCQPDHRSTLQCSTVKSNANCVPTDRPLWLAETSCAQVCATVNRIRRAIRSRPLRQWPARTFFVYPDVV